MKKGMVILLLFLLAGCAVVEDELSLQITDSTNIGLTYLDEAHSPYYFEDEYLKFVYETEDIECPIEGCTVTYRHMDAYFNILFMEDEIRDVSKINEQVIEAHKVFDAITPIWQETKINNAILSEDSTGYALDSMCILGLVQKDKKIAEMVKSYLTEDNNWMHDNYYIGDVWRNYADEAWCIQLLIVTGEKDSVIKPLIDKLITQTDIFLAEEHTETEDLAVVMHTVYVLSYARDHTNLDYRQQLVRYNDFIGWYAEKSIVIDNNLMMSNMLHSLVSGEYDNFAILENMAETILSKQHAEGFWTMTSDPVNPLPVFTTSRALIGLNAYKEYRAKNKDKIRTIK